MRLSKRERVEWKARKYLHRICAILGALPRYGGCPEARWDTAQYEFWIWPNSMMRIDKLTGQKQTTCLKQPGRIPDAEKVASILLLVHHDPRNFETWRRQAGIITVERK